jgi:hypothetical protein
MTCDHRSYRALRRVVWLSMRIGWMIIALGVVNMPQITTPLNLGERVRRKPCTIDCL